MYSYAFYLYVLQIWAIQTLNDLQGLIAFSISARTVRIWETDTAKFVDVSTQSWMGADD